MSMTPRLMFSKWPSMLRNAMIRCIDCGTNCVSRPNRNSTNEIANATMNADDRVARKRRRHDADRDVGAAHQQRPM